MRGRGRMFAIAASTIAVLACQGCTTAAEVADIDSGVSTPVEPSEGIQLAAPAPLGVPDTFQAGTSALNQIDTSAIPTGTTFFMSELSADGLSDDNTSDAAIRLTVMANTIEAALPTTDWAKSDAVAIIAARQNAEKLISPLLHEDDKDFSAEFLFDAPSEVTGFAFDLGVVPRLAYREDGELKTRSFGGEVRIGQNFDKRGSAQTPGSWYIFAGADGEALTYEPGDEGFASFDSDAVALRDQVTVGDMQAGVSVQRGGGQLSLSYIRREVSYHERGIRGVSENEDFAGVSFTLKR